jgi:ATP-dependent Clp protease ATP-binding subunit ClpA
VTGREHISKRYITAGSADKAVDLLDTAAARVGTG